MNIIRIFIVWKESYDMSDVIDQIFEISKLAEFLREDAAVLINAHELTSLTLIVQEGWRLGSKIAQLRKEPESAEGTPDALAKMLRYQATLINEISKNHAQNLVLINHITRFSQNLHRMVREVPYIEDAEYRNELIIKKKTGFIIDESTFHYALRELSTLFSKLGDLQPTETPTCPLSVLLLQIARVLGIIEHSLQVNVVYRGSPKILTVLTQLGEEFPRVFQPIYWVVKQNYFQDEIKNALQAIDSLDREEQSNKAKKSKKPKELTEALKTLEKALDRESQKKEMPPMDTPLLELK